MTLIKSISGIRGTIGGKVSENLTPLDVVKFTAAYAHWIKKQRSKDNYRIVVGRDARISGNMVQNLVMHTLVGMGIHVVDVGLSTTPTVEMAVTMEHADGGIILTASHNPKQWNALKLLNNKGEFIDAKAGEQLLEIVENENYSFSFVDDLGKITLNEAYIDLHIQAILDLPLVNQSAIDKARFKIVVDGVNSTGGIAVPLLLEKLGVDVVKLYCEPNGHFPHNPEPLKEHLTDLSDLVKKQNADLGIVVDPDVDRLAFVDENGEMFGEEYTLVACADYVLSHHVGNTVSNMSSTRALRDVTESYGGKYRASAVGEVNVVEMMKQTQAVIGGEGNGGIIYPELHYGRDALVGIALFLSHLAAKNNKVGELKASYPQYYMAKKKLQLTPNTNINQLLNAVKQKFNSFDINEIDGVKINFEDSWVHLRMSNTEPIMRIYTEAKTKQEADKLGNDLISFCSDLM